MTMPDEELRALKNTRDFLRHLLGSNVTTIRKEAREIRDRAYRCLKHYPFDIYLDKMWKERIEETNKWIKEK